MEDGELRQIDAIIGELDQLTRDLDRVAGALTGKLPMAARRRRRQITRLRKQIDHNLRALRSELGRARRRTRPDPRMIGGAAAAATARDIAGLIDQFAAEVGGIEVMGRAVSSGSRAARERAHVVAMHLNGEADITKGWPELPWKR